jgi:hypothetical protein
MDIRAAQTPVAAQRDARSVRMRTGWRCPGYRRSRRSVAKALVRNPDRARTEWQQRLSVTSAKTDGDVARRLIARAAIRRWSRWWMARTGGSMATVIPCVLRVEARKGRGPPVQSAVEICRAPTGPTCRPTDRPTARPRRHRRELRSAHGWPCRGPASDRVDRWSRPGSVPGRGPSGRRAEDRVSAGPPTVSVLGRRPC